MIKNISLLIIAAAGIFLLYSASSILIQSRNALFWPQTKAHVLSSSLTINHLPKFLDWEADPIRWYGVSVRYKYTVDYMTYFSNRLSFQSGETRESKDALAVMNRYRKHQDVMVFYDPNNPEESVLEPGDIEDAFMPLLLGGMFVYLGLFAFRNPKVEFNRGVNWHVQQGQIYQNQGKLEEALWQYNQAVSMSPNHVLGYINRGNFFLQYNSWDRAIADFDQVLAIDPKNALAHFTLAKAYLGKKEYQKAFEHVEKAQGMGFNVRPDILENIKKNLV